MFSQFTKVSLEGAIGVGKSSLLEKLKSFPDVTVHPEPIERWKSFNEGFNMLDELYKNPNFTMGFQTFVLADYLYGCRKLENEIKENDTKIIITERTPYSSIKIFGESLLKNRLELGTLIFLYEQIKDKLIIPDLIFYLRGNKELCLKRIRNRGRCEEEEIDENYCDLICQNYEKWNEMEFKPYSNSRIIVLNAEDSVEDLCDKIMKETINFRKNK